MQIIDCAANEVKYSGLAMDDAIKKFENLGGKRMGYCIAIDDEVVFSTDNNTIDVKRVKEGDNVKEGFLF